MRTLALVALLAVMAVVWWVRLSEPTVCRHVEIRRYTNAIKSYAITVCVTEKTVVRNGEHIETRYTDELFNY